MLNYLIICNKSFTCCLNTHVLPNKWYLYNIARKQMRREFSCLRMKHTLDLKFFILNFGATSSLNSLYTSRNATGSSVSSLALESYLYNQNYMYICQWRDMCVDIHLSQTRLVNRHSKPAITETICVVQQEIGSRTISYIIFEDITVLSIARLYAGHDIFSPVIR